MYNKVGVSQYFSSRFKVTNAVDSLKVWLIPRLTLSTALWKKELLAARPTLLAHDDMKVRLELFSESARAGAVSALRNGGGSCNPQTDILAGSFRKLQVDWSNRTHTNTSHVAV